MSIQLNEASVQELKTDILDRLNVDIYYQLKEILNEAACFRTTTEFQAAMDYFLSNLPNVDWKDPVKS